MVRESDKTEARGHVPEFDLGMCVCVCVCTCVVHVSVCVMLANFQQYYVRTVKIIRAQSILTGFTAISTVA